MRTLLLSLVLAATACGAKKSANKPTPPPEPAGTTSDETGAGDSAKPDDPDEQPSKAAEDPDAGGE